MDVCDIDRNNTRNDMSHHANAGTADVNETLTHRPIINVHVCEFRIEERRFKYSDVAKTDWHAVN